MFRHALPSIRPQSGSARGAGMPARPQHPSTRPSARSPTGAPRWCVRRERWAAAARTSPAPAWRGRAGVAANHRWTHDGSAWPLASRLFIPGSSPRLVRTLLPLGSGYVKRHLRRPAMRPGSVPLSLGEVCTPRRKALRSDTLDRLASLTQLRPRLLTVVLLPGALHAGVTDDGSPDLLMIRAELPRKVGAEGRYSALSAGRRRPPGLFLGRLPYPAARIIKRSGEPR